MSQIRLLVLGSDLHVGSTRAIMPPGLRTLEGNPIGMNPFQEWLWTCWLKAHAWLADVTGSDDYAMVWNGDLTEGIHHGANQVISNQTDDHVEPAIQLLTIPPVRRPKKIFAVKGTDCHSREKEDTIGRAIGAEKNPETGRHSFDILLLEICGKLVSVRHHFPATSRAYLEASQHSIQMGNAIVEAHRNRERIPDILVGAHRHRPGHFSDGTSLTVVTAAWQGLTRHGFKVVPDGKACPGFYVLDWRNRDDGELPEVHFCRYETPPQAPQKL